MCITLSHQVKQCEVGPVDNRVLLIGAARMIIQADTHTKVTGPDGDTLDLEHWIIVIIWDSSGGLEENLRHERSTSPKRRTIRGAN